MKYIKKNLVLMIAGFVLSLSAASAMAATIDAGVDLNATSNDVSIPFQNARLAQFDSSLGALTGVSLILEGSYSSILTATNLLPSLINKCQWVIEPYSMEIKSASLPVSASDTVNKVI